MFCIVMTRNALRGYVPEWLYEALFDTGFRRLVHDVSGRDFVEREGIAPSRTGRTGVGDAGSIRRCQVPGSEARLATAHRVRNLIGEAPFRLQVRRGLDMFSEPAKTKPWVADSLRNAQFVPRLQRVGSPYLITVDWVRGVRNCAAGSAVGCLLSRQRGCRSEFLQL